MVISLDEYKRLKAKVEEAEKKATKAEGAFEESMGNLKSLGYDSIESAEQALEQIKASVGDAEKKLDAAVKEFRQKWGSSLGI